MQTLMRIAAVAAVVLLGAPPVFAQGAYVGASIGADIARFGSGYADPSPGTGEALSWALRVGAPVGSLFGVELEFVRPQEIERESVPDVRILQANSASFSWSSVVESLGLGTVAPTVFPPISYSIRTAERHTTVAATAWVRQEISPRFTMAYLGGVTFARTDLDYEYSFSGFTGFPGSGIVPASSVERVVRYSAGPVVGTEARIGMTDHVQLVPGVRLHAFDGGWVVRPAVGIAWQF
jgi:hypothetical protein